jgi:hypothetical protein
MMSMADGGGSAAGQQEDLVLQPNILNAAPAAGGGRAAGQASVTDSARMPAPASAGASEADLKKLTVRKSYL